MGFLRVHVWIGDWGGKRNTKLIKIRGPTKETTHQAFGEKLIHGEKKNTFGEKYTAYSNFGFSATSLAVFASGAGASVTSAISTSCAGASTSSAGTSPSAGASLASLSDMVESASNKVVEVVEMSGWE